MPADSCLAEAGPKPWSNKPWSNSARAQWCAAALQILGRVHEQRLAIGDRAMELLQNDIEGRQGRCFDGAVLETIQRIAQDFVGFRLQPVEVCDGIAPARGRDHFQKSFAQARAVAPLILF